MNQTADKTSGQKSTNTPISEKVSEDVIEGLANGKSQELLVSFDSAEIDALVESLIQQGEFEVDSDPVTDLVVPLDPESPGVENDNFQNSNPISGISSTVNGTNNNATSEQGEPASVSEAGENNSVWWSWTAPTSGQVTVDTFGSNFDTVLAAYTGDFVSDLTEIASNDGSALTLLSEIVFDAVEGTTYHFVVDGFSDETGEIVLNLSQEVTEVENDNFSNNISLTGSSANVTAFNFEATSEDGEPLHAENLLAKNGGSSVWWNWTAPTSGLVTIGTNGSDFDTVLGIYTGDSVSNITEVASDDDSGEGFQSLVTFDAVEGTNYKIAVDGYLGEQGNIVLDLVQQTTPISNDNFAESATLTGTSDSATTSNVNASLEADEPNHAGNSGGSSLWWNWTAPTSGLVTIGTNGSDFDTVLGIYTGDSVSNITEVASDDDSGEGFQSLVTFDAVEGTNYKIAVDGYLGEQGNIVLDLVQQTTPISNDNFAESATLTGTSDSATTSNVNASLEADEPNHAGNSGGSSLWWNWTAP
ncbi:MAG: hypothetical protein F6K24_03385, partial [Okeania sp. SIO2D1]|nr:hypothetical protein [Okeania sp. SIO2D1]